MKKEKFDSFFKIHSENVDNANNQGFWKLSDEIVKNYLLEIIKVANFMLYLFYQNLKQKRIYFIDS